MDNLIREGEFLSPLKGVSETCKRTNDAEPNRRREGGRGREFSEMGRLVAKYTAEIQIRV